MKKKKKKKWDMLLLFSFTIKAIERLSDFCYNCGRLSHVTGRCKLRKAATITTKQGLVPNLYGPWLRAEDPGSLLFVNPPPVQCRVNVQRALQDACDF